LTISSPDLHRIVYVSAAVDKLSRAALDDLLAVARSRNSEHGITGALLYADGDFIQLLEGPRDQVLETFRHIQNSPLHRGVIALINGPATERQFANWSMAYSQASWNQLTEVQSAWRESGDAAVGVLKHFATSRRFN
jgi:hypothetical protein